MLQCPLRCILKTSFTESLIWLTGPGESAGALFVFRVWCFVFGALRPWPCFVFGVWCLGRFALGRVSCLVCGVWGASPLATVSSLGEVLQTPNTKHETRPRAKRPKHQTPNTIHHTPYTTAGSSDQKTLSHRFYSGRWKH